MPILSSPFISASFSDSIDSDSVNLEDIVGSIGIVLLWLISELSDLEFFFRTTVTGNSNILNFSFELQLMVILIPPIYKC